MGGPGDKSNGYEEAAQQFIAARNTPIGIATVREWSRSLRRGGKVLDLGCAHGVPIAQLLIDSGFRVYGVDASATLIAEFRRRFPTASAQCVPVEDSDFFGRQFDGIIAVGLLFLLSSETQEIVLQRAALTMASSCSPLQRKRCDGTIRSPGESQFRLAQRDTGNYCAVGEWNCSAKQTTKAGITIIFAGNSELPASRTSLTVLENESAEGLPLNIRSFLTILFCCTQLPL